MKKIWIFLCMLSMGMLTLSANTRESVILSKCVDGDTTHFIRNGVDIKVRYLAINAPEYTKEKEPYGEEASEYVCEVLTNAKQIELEYDDGSDTLDTYGRTLAWVYADGKLIQEELVKQGLAEVKYIYGDYAYTDQLKELENMAKKEHKNMWSEEPSSDTQTTMIRVGSGVVLLVIGIVFTKGKRNKKKWVKRGIQKIKRG